MVKNMKTILNTPLREQAGSMTYNRFEYQTTWSLQQMIKKYTAKEQFFIFCEFHDDVAEIEDCTKNDRMIFYQVKTKDSGNFTFNKVFQKIKQKNHSFIGYLFYNFLKFGEECSACYFISNRPFDKDLKIWKESVENKVDLQHLDPELYDRIKKNLKSEFNLDKKKFDGVFDTFIKNTYLVTSDLSLDKHINEVKMYFLESLQFGNLQLQSAFKIFDFLSNEVRKKAQKKIQFPISLENLKSEKGLDNSIFQPIENLKSENTIANFLDNIAIFNFDPIKTLKLKKAYKKHFEYFLDLNNIVYNDLITTYLNICKLKIAEIYNTVNDLNKLTHNFKVLIAQNNHLYNKLIENILITNDTLEALFYNEFLIYE